MIERNFDIPFIANLALREKQIQQNYRPVIAVHKWFARRPGTLFRGLLLSEFSQKPLRESFYQSNDLKGKKIADPFIGGGIPLLEANRVGCEVLGYDINPMAYWIVRQELEHLDLQAYSQAAEKLRLNLEKEIGHLYRTRCEHCGKTDAHVKYFLWVKTKNCEQCKKDFDLFPGYLISQDRRHPKNVFLCSKCGELTETRNRKEPGTCSHCNQKLLISGPAKRNQCPCPHCKKVNSFAKPENGPPAHRLFALEYHCHSCKPTHKGRFFKTPAKEDLNKVKEADRLWKIMRHNFIPKDKILSGDESNRLLRWGYQYYRDMFNNRQLMGLELSCRIITKQPDERIRNALATNLSDLLRYQNMLCRYDSMALKSLDIFSVHGFPVGLIQCESNLLGIRDPRKKVNVGSGGWSNIWDKFYKAKVYCDFPFEIKHSNGKKIQVPIGEEWIGDIGNGNGHAPRKVEIACKDASGREVAKNSLDAVFTDPPYFGNVQYAELMDFCYVWLRKLLGKNIDAFQATSTRNKDELTGNEDMGRDLIHFTDGISNVFQKMAYGLKSGSPLVFTYHHNNFKAYYPLAVALLDANLTCSASLPCPAEMGASIHIKNTQSSITDTVFVARSTGKVPQKWLVDSPHGLSFILKEDIHYLKQANMKPTKGDIRCIFFGHLIRLACWSLRKEWDKTISTKKRIQKIEDWIWNFCGKQGADEYLSDFFYGTLANESMMVKEIQSAYDERKDDEVSF